MRDAIDWRMEEATVWQIQARISDRIGKFGYLRCMSDSFDDEFGGGLGRLLFSFALGIFSARENELKRSRLVSPASSR